MVEGLPGAEISLPSAQPEAMLATRVREAIRAAAQSGLSTFFRRVVYGGTSHWSLVSPPRHQERGGAKRSVGLNVSNRAAG